MHSKKKTIATGMIGNMLEWYDFSLYGYFATLISTKFFPSENALLSLLATFGVFASGYLMRPLGAVVFGHFGDRLGRKKTLSLSVIMMACSTTAVGLLPTHEQIGLLAGVLLTLCRLFQGFAIGGECSGSILYMVEHAPVSKRGFFGSIFNVSTYVGLLLGSATGAAIGLLMGAEDFAAWGWRVPFLAGSVLGVIGYYLRTRMPETPAFISCETDQHIVKIPVLALFRDAPFRLLQGIGLVLLPATFCYVLFIYVPTYLAKDRGIQIAEGLLFNSISMLLMVVAIPLLGKLSDHIGRKPILLLGSILFLMASFLLFKCLHHTETVATILGIQMVFALMLSCAEAALPSSLAELFPTSIRYSATGLSYNVANGIFGGTTPFVTSLLVAAYGIEKGLTAFVLLFASITFCAALSLKESYRNSL